MASGAALLEFGILGPLEIRSPGRPVELRRVKERTLLGLLLLHLNEVVSLDHLAAGLWQSSDSPRPPATLRVHVSRLRHALADAGMVGDTQLSTMSLGYMLKVPPEAVDARRFEQLAAAGRELAAAGDHTEAARALSAALALWRGRVLSDLSLSIADEPEIVRLEESRLGVLEDRVDADLRRGRHHELVGELEQLVTDSPLRERLWGQRIVALYRDGRQAEALRAYEELRVMLREELGIRPSPALQQLERAVLDQDPGLDVPAAAPTQLSPAPEARTEGASPAAGRLAVRFPNRLAPASAMRFAGRREEVGALTAAWKASDAGERQVVLISGEAGIGKTRLAAEVARVAHDDGGAVDGASC